MLSYCYGFSYTYCHEAALRGNGPGRVDAKLYALAGKYNIIPLREAAEKAFKYHVPDSWSSFDQMFADLDTIYNHIPSCDRTLRNVVVKITTTDEDLWSSLSREQMDSLLARCDGFALDSNSLSEPPGEYQCWNCLAEVLMRLPRSDSEEVYCQACGHSNSAGRWRLWSSF